MKIFTIGLVGLVIILIALGSKYKTVYEVSLNGERLGYVNNIEKFQEKIDENIYIENKAVAFTIEENMPKYEVLLSKNTVDINEEQVLEEVLKNQLVAYKDYTIVLDGKETETVESMDEAIEIVDEIKSNYENELSLDLGIVENINYNNDEFKELSDVELAKAALEDDVNTKIKMLDSTVNDIYLEKPIEGLITSRYGVYSSIRTGAHTGLDIAAPTGTEINPCASGVVEKAEYSGSYGNLVIVDHGNGVKTYYAHCSKILVSVGEEVTTNTVIALVGSTGNSTGPHLHLEIKIDEKTVNPQEYLYKNN